MSKAKILIVEDELIIAMDIRKSLENNGYIVADQTDRGEDAIKKSGELRPDLVLMDIHLKGSMDGIEAATQIRAQFDLPVIFLTAFANPTTLQLARQAEPFGYVLKPFVERELVSNIEMSLYKHSLERKLRESEERFRRLANNAPDIIIRYEISPAMRLSFINPAVETIAGYTPDECYTDPNLILNMIHPDDLNMMTNYLQSLTLPDGPMLARWIGKDGTVRWMESRMVPVFDTTGQMVAVEGITRDITHQMKIEAEREKLVAELKSKNTELDQFTYTVSHDLKSPLITIGGFLGFLEKDVLNGDTEKIKSDMARINEAIGKMQRLINELLELSRVGRIMNPPQSIPFGEILQDAISRTKGMLEARGVQVNIGSDLPIVYGDRTRLVQVVQNLVENAAKFMGDQPFPCIEIGRCSTDDSGKPIFFVKDNGIGIKPQYYSRIFGLFDKLNTTSPGTGIGLALVKKIIEIHEGSIWVESDGVNGTTFYFALPEARKNAG